MSQIEMFKERLPAKPYCSNDLDAEGLKIRSKQLAALKKYIQHNKPTEAAWLVYDIDYAGVLDYIGAQQLPCPNIVATNKKNGRAHIFYGLKAPVYLTEGSSKKAQSLLNKIDFVLTNELEADRGYVGLVSKNPLNSDAWLVQEVNQIPWDLVDFLEYLTLPDKLPARARVEGFGRNITLFDSMRRWAYQNVLAYRLTGSRAKFFDAVLGECEIFNAAFPTPLGFPEVKATAKSIAKWTWYKYTGRVSDEEFSKIQAVRGAKGGTRSGTVRLKKNEEKRAQAIEMAAHGKKQKDIAAALDVSTASVCLWLKAV
jgi:hypothetical protein